jgi:hypothetical protein
MEHCINFIETNNFSLTFKKIDSTMRGNIKFELELLRKFYKKLIIIPANPEYGRTIQKCTLLVNGVPVSKTIYGRDIHSPTKDSCILSHIPKGVLSLTLDISKTEDFDKLLNIGNKYFPVGSSAFFYHWFKTRGKNELYSKKKFHLTGKTLFINGSLNPISKNDEKKLGYPIFRIDEELGEINGESYTLNTRNTQNYSSLENYSSKLKNIIISGEFDNIIVSGGETLKEFCKIFAIREMIIHSSLAPGLPIFTITLDSKRINIIPKPGGYPLFK